MKPILLDGKITEVIARIRTLETENPEDRDKIEGEARYFEKHAKQRQHKSFVKKGIRLGVV